MEAHKTADVKLDGREGGSKKGEGRREWRPPRCPISAQTLGTFRRLFFASRIKRRELGETLEE